MTPNDWKILARFGVTPDNLSVGGWLFLRDSAITTLPDNLSVGGWLFLRDSAITTLPDNLSVGGWLDLSGTAITTLPDNLSVGGSLHLSGTAITTLYKDPRGYRLDRAGDYYHAGCRRFTAAEAVAHWGAPQYPDPERGAAYVAAVTAEEARRKEKDQ